MKDSLAVLQNISSYNCLRLNKDQHRPLDRFTFDYPYLVPGTSRGAKNDEISICLFGLPMWQLSISANKQQLMIHRLSFLGHVQTWSSWPQRQLMRKLFLTLCYIVVIRLDYVHWGLENLQYFTVMEFTATLILLAFLNFFPGLCSSR